MAIIDGTPNDDTLPGTNGDDTINGLDGNDTINPGPGKDTVSAGAGDDTIVLTDPGHIAFNGTGFEFDSYDGGTGHDAIEFHPWLSAPSAEYPYGPQSNYGLAGVSGVERLVLASTESIDILVTTGITQIAGGITEVVGGSGRDMLMINVAGISGSFTMPSLALFNWTSSATPDLDGGDIVILQATPNGNFTLNAREGLASAQSLFSGGGNDTLNGSSGVDMLNGNGGTNVLNGFGGNDILAIVNSKDSAGNLSSFTGAGSTFDGGSGTDALSIGGVVDFQGTLISIERIHLQAAWASPLTNGFMAQVAANLTISAATMNALPASLGLAGNGTITVNLAPGDGYNASGFVVAGGSSITHLVNGSSANDPIRGLQTADTLNGNDGDDTLVGNGGNDNLFGGAGADQLIGGAGADAAAGGAGEDWYFIDNALDSVTEAAGEGANDRVFASVSYTQGAGVQVEKLTTIDNNATTAINLSGNELANIVYGNAGANVLDGKAGNDTLSGLAGNDTLIGSLGNDSMAGGTGDDWYYVDSTSDVVIEFAGEGTGDRILTSVSYTLGAGIEVERLTTDSNAGTSAINLTGSSVANLIYGNAGTNILDGRGGADTLIGFGGDDWYYVDNAGDSVTEAAGEGTADRVLASVSYTLGAGAQVERLTTDNNSGTSAIDLTGNELANLVYGNNGTNALDGKGGADLLTGFAGADSFAFTTALGAGNVDLIGDFSVADDTIVLENAVFAGLAAGALATGAFVIGAAADADDRIVYDSTTGALYFDTDGNGAGAAVQFATLAPALAITAGDFLVI